MGALVLPPAGKVYIDSNCLIYSVEKHLVYAPILRSLWQAAQMGNITILSSELVLAETLVGPLRYGDAALANLYEQAFLQPGLTLLPITPHVLREVARIRAVVPAIRTPDAIHAATALLDGCVLFLTNDDGFKRVPGLPFLLLDDVLAAP
jgi:predicted nucleic acid-binding protein